MFQDIVYRAIPSDPDAPAPISTAAKASSSGDGIGLLQSLLSSINSKAAPRRALFSLPFEIGPGLKISVKGYIIVKRQEPARTCYVWLNGERPQIAVGSSTQIAEDTARTVEKAEIRKAYKFGGETVSFSKEEMSAIRHFGDPVIRIIGFKPQDLLPVWANIRPPIFMYPSEADYIGSTRVFSALQQKLLKDHKMGVAWFIPRRNAAPTIAAIVPGLDRYSDDGDQETPPGLWIIPLPFADDIRQNPETTLVRSPDSLVDLMRTVVQQLQLPKAIYDPKRYPNPSLQWHYRVLQALALEEDFPDKPEDKTIPKYRQIDKVRSKDPGCDLMSHAYGYAACPSNLNTTSRIANSKSQRAGHYVIEWGQELEQQYQAWQAEHGHKKLKSATAFKRSADSADNAPAKKVKTASGSSAEAVDDESMRRHFIAGTLSKVSIHAARTARGCGSSGTRG